MTLIQDASTAITGLHTLTSSFGNNAAPDPYSVLAYQSKIVSLYEKLGQEMSRKFGKKESEYLSRKISEAKAYRHGRIELKKTGGDSAQYALEQVEKDMERENQAAEEYESYRLMLQSLDKAFQHSFQVVSFVKSSESRPSYNQ